MTNGLCKVCGGRAERVTINSSVSVWGAFCSTGCARIYREAVR